MEPFLGEICLFGFGFVPTGWARCDGRLLSISQNTALFSLLGTAYGGDGRTTFALPDLRGRVPIGSGDGPGLSHHEMGEVGGSERVTLTAQQLPAHTHPVSGSSAGKPSDDAAQPGTSGGSPGAVTDIALGPATAGPEGQPHPNLPPYLALNWCIALEGIYPSRQ